ncbi:hypothetical protein BGX38DRAFT_1166600, partial [Terfezia claveryi]
MQEPIEELLTAIYHRLCGVCGFAHFDTFRVHMHSGAHAGSLNYGLTFQHHQILHPLSISSFLSYV